jgi:transglutaminase-like putative cysteine protease
MKPSRPAVLACLLLPLLAAWPATAQDFPPVTDEERALTSVPGEPNAPAVVLFRKGEFLMAGYGRFIIGSLASHLRVQGRVKILTEAGKSNGELVVSHGGSLRLQNFSGRTVLPDGRILPVPADAKFQRRTSKSSKTFVTSIAFPAVQAGAILDYQYEVTFASPYVLEPWQFSEEEMPVRHSEVVYKTAREWSMKVWSRAPMGVKIQQAKQTSPSGDELRAWADDLPAIPRVPYSLPYADLATQILMLPGTHRTGRRLEIYLDSWTMTSDILGSIYDQVRKRDEGVAKQAARIAGAGSPRQRAEALYRYVRDEIQGKEGYGVWIDSEISLQQILAERSADPTGKALLLQALLKAAGIDSSLAWAAERSRGAVDTKLPNPSWFDTVLVMTKLDDQRTFLDPSSPALAFGQIRAEHEGTPALIPDAKKPLGIVLPETPFDQNLRRAEIDLALDEKGSLAGTGTLRLTGLHAVERIRWQDDQEKTVQAWKDWLDGRYRDFKISDVRAVEAPDERKVTVTWSMAQLQEEVLGDEATVVPSAPLGPAFQPFVQTAAERKLDIIFDYPDREEVELRLRWPAAWYLDQRPRPAAVNGPCGALSAGLVVNEPEHTLVYRRRFDITRRRLGSKEEYEAVRDLFGEAAKNDALVLTLVRR